MRKHLLISVINNYEWDDLIPFFNSYKLAKFENCECVMFTENVPDSTLEKMRNFGITVSPVPERFNGCRANGFRWELYRDYIADNMENYDMIFTADTRDLIFQDDVFKHCNPDVPFLGFAYEDVLIANSDRAKEYIIKFFGDEAFEAVKENLYICMGTVWGTSEKFYEFAKCMSEYIGPDKYKVSMSDQAIANYLIYHEKILNRILSQDDNVIYSSNSEGYVMTIGLLDHAKLTIDSEGRILNAKGDIASVVHQYDRNPEAIKAVMKKYCEGMSLFSRFVFRNYNKKAVSFCKRLTYLIRRERKRGNLIRALTDEILRRLKLKVL